MRYGIVDIVGRIRVKLLADAAAEAVYTPPDGSLAYRQDTAQIRERLAGAWVKSLAGALASDAEHGVRGGDTLHALATALAAGFMSPADFSKLAGITTGSSTPFLSWGNNNVGATTAVRYLEPWWDDTLAPTGTPTQYRLLRAATLTNARVRHNIPHGNNNAIVYTLRLNGIGTALSVSLGSNTQDSAVDASVVAGAAGDLVDIEVTKAADVGTSPNNVLFMCECQA